MPLRLMSFGMCMNQFVASMILLVIPILSGFSKPFKMKDFMLFFVSVHTFVLNGTMEDFLFGCIICPDVRFELLMMFTLYSRALEVYDMQNVIFTRKIVL